MTGPEEYRRWLACGQLTEEERAELSAIASDEGEIRERFFAPLEFGTAGLRGIMGAGIRRMNARMVRLATRGLAALVLRQGADFAARGVVVCCDCRVHSRDYAIEAARVLAYCGIPALLFAELRPTPELSFAIRLYGAAAGINITASHNPKEYNGYKVYWDDGAQLPPEYAARVAAEMAQLDVLEELPLPDYGAAVADGRIRLLGAETDEAFLREILRRSIHPEAIQQAGLRIVYTPFYGAGAKLVPEALKRLGAAQLHCVAEQMEPDGSFPTAKNPNPEFEIGFERALLLAREVDADLILGTDPDSDRLGVMVRDGGAYRLLSGNQVGVLLLDYLIAALRETGRMPAQPVALKSLVSSEMARAVAEAGGVAMEDTFTGFKFLAERMKQYENGDKTVIFAYEEAIGYAVGDFVRDKDAVTAAVLAAEMASVYALRGFGLAERLEQLYAALGRYEERTISLVMPGVDGIARMRALMERLRTQPPAELGGVPVAERRDYLGGELAAADGAVTQLPLRGSDVLYFVLADGSRFAVRPSGTEPKIKVYLMVRGCDAADCGARLDALEAAAQALCQ